jgi:pimeloyl-ACP methyl ester carboxylesterase
MLHGFPTWSYDYAAVASDLERAHEVVTLDFLGYGASDKPNPYEYSVAESADIVEQLVSLLELRAVNLVIHDYGSIVGQELLDRGQRGTLTFDVSTVTVFNCGLVYRAYRPTRLQKLLALPVIGPLISGRVTEDRVRAGLDGVRGSAKLTDAEFANLWYGISANNGHKLAHLHIRYNAERAKNHQRWESAMSSYDGPVHLVWGMADPVSGKHVLDLARGELPRATITELPDVGHFPMEEAPALVAAAMRKGI